MMMLIILKDAAWTWPCVWTEVHAVVDTCHEFTDLGLKQHSLLLKISELVLNYNSIVTNSLVLLNMMQFTDKDHIIHLICFSIIGRDTVKTGHLLALIYEQYFWEQCMEMGVRFLFKFP